MQFSRYIVFLFMAVLAAPSLLANEIQDSFVVNRVTNNVFIAHPYRIKKVNSTSTIIVGSGYLTVVESQADITLAKTLIGVIRKKISTLPIRYLVFSHFHTDHILGAGAFLQENPGLIIVAHQKTAEHILLQAAQDQNVWAGIVKEKALEARNSAISALTPKKDELIRTADELHRYYEDIKLSVIVPPTLSFSDSLILYDNDRQIQIKYFGSGHTPGDIVVYVPQDKLLVTGDLVHDFEPLFWNADPGSWTQTLGKIKQLDFEYFVGGHGGSHRGKEIINLWQNYVEELKTKTKEAIRQGLTLEVFQKKITLDSFVSLQNGYAERIQQFRTGYMEYWTGPLLDAVKDEISYLWRYYIK